MNDNLFGKNNKMNNIIKNKLTPLVNKPTRVMPMSSALIDLIITNKPDAVSSYDVVPQENTIHNLISIVVDVSKPKRQPIIRTLRHLGNYSNDTFCSSLIQSIHCVNRIILT